MQVGTASIRRIQFNPYNNGNDSKPRQETALGIDAMAVIVRCYLRYEDNRR